MIKLYLKMNSKEALKDIGCTAKSLAIAFVMFIAAMIVVSIWGCEKDQIYRSPARRSATPYMIGWHGAYGGDTVRFDTTAISVMAVTSSSGAVEYTYRYNTYMGNQCRISVTDINGGILQQGDVLSSRAVTYYQPRYPENDTLFQLLTPYPAHYTSTSDTCRIDLGWCVSPFNGLNVHAFILLNCN